MPGLHYQEPMFKFLSDVIAAATVSADWIGIRAVKDTNRVAAIRDAHPERNAQQLGHGAMVEVLVQGQFGYSATNNLSAASLAQAIVSAYNQAVAASAWAVHSFTAAARPKATGSYISPHRKGLDALSPAELNQILLQICERLKLSDKIAQTSASARSHDIETWFVSSNGSEIYQRDYLVETHFGTIAQDGPTRVDIRRAVGAQQDELAVLGDRCRRSRDAMAIEHLGDHRVETLGACGGNAVGGAAVGVDRVAVIALLTRVHLRVAADLEARRVIGDRVAGARRRAVGFRPGAPDDGEQEAEARPC